MRHASGRLRRALAAAAVLSAAALSAAPGPAIAAGGGTATTPNSLTTQYPLGTSTLCCRQGQPRRATAAPSRAKRATGRSGGHGSSQTRLLRAVGVIVLVLVLAGLSAGRVLGRWRQRRSRQPRPSVVKAPVPAVSVSRAEGSASKRRPPSTETAYDPLRGLSLEALTGERWEAERHREPGESAEVLSDGEGVYRFGVILFERGQLEAAAAAWRLAAARHHPRAATKLGMLLEERGDVEAARQAYADAQRWGDRAAAELASRLTHVPER